MLPGDLRVLWHDSVRIALDEPSRQRVAASLIEIETAGGCTVEVLIQSLDDRNLTALFTPHDGRSLDDHLVGLFDTESLDLRIADASGGDHFPQLIDLRPLAKLERHLCTAREVDADIQILLDEHFEDRDR